MWLVTLTGKFVSMKLPVSVTNHIQSSPKHGDCIKTRVRVMVFKFSKKNDIHVGPTCISFFLENLKIQ